MRDNQTTRRMPMIVTAMACATASMLAGLALAPSAMAAGATITLNGADGNSLAGHTFNVYQIGTYTDQILNGTQISSLGVRGTTASNAWAADAISIANAYDPDTGDNIAKVYGYDDAGNIANIKMDSQTRQLRNISKALSQSSRRPAVAPRIRRSNTTSARTCTGTGSRVTDTRSPGGSAPTTSRRTATASGSRT